MFQKNKRRKPGNAPKGNYSFRGRKVRAGATYTLEYNPETEASVHESRKANRRQGFRVAVILIGCMALVALGRLVVKEAFINNERFHLQDFSVATDGPLSPDQLVSATGLHHGTNMLMIPLTAIRDRLEALPEVRKARVIRDYPGVLTLEVEQRKPVAWLQATGGSDVKKVPAAGCMLDADGVMLPDFKNGTAGLKLPHIIVEKLPRVVPGRPVDSIQVMAALQLLAAKQDAAQGGNLEISSIDATKKYGLQATSGNGGLTIMFANGGYDKQFKRLELVMTDAAKRNRTLATVNLLVEQNVPVTFRDAGSTAGAVGEKRTEAPKRSVASAN